MLFLMQARSSADLTLKSWVASSPDFAGTGFPGPGLPEYIAVSKRILSSESASTSPPGAKEGARATTTGALPAYTRTGNVLTANANGALSAALLDNVVSPQPGQRYLLRGEHLSSHAHAGIYTLTALGAGGAPWSFTRATDFDSASEVRPGAHLWIHEGDDHGGNLAVLTAPATGAVVVNTTGLTFELFPFCDCADVVGLDLVVRSEGDLLEGANNTLDFKGGGLTAVWDEATGAYVVNVPGVMVENGGTPDGGAGGGALNFIGGAQSVWNAGKNRHDITVSALPATSDVGAMAIYQGAGVWVAVAPGAKTHVWTVDETTGLPGWSEPAAGGGGEVVPTIFYDEGTAKTERHAIDVVGRELIAEDLNPALAYNASAITSFASVEVPLSAVVALPAITDPLLVVSVGIEVASGSLTGVAVTYNGVRMRQLTTHNSGSLHQYTFALASGELPSAAGNYRLAVQLFGTATANVKVGHAFFAGAGLKVPTHTANANATGTAVANPITAADDSILVDFVFAALDGTISGTVAGSQTERQDSDAGNSWMGISTLAGAGATTMNWTLSTSSAWVSTAIEIPVSLARTRLRGTSAIGRHELTFSAHIGAGVASIVAEIDLAALVPKTGLVEFDITVLQMGYYTESYRASLTYRGQPGAYTSDLGLRWLRAFDATDLKPSDVVWTLAVVADVLQLKANPPSEPLWVGIYVTARTFPRTP